MARYLQASPFDSHASHVTHIPHSHTLTRLLRNGLCGGCNEEATKLNNLQPMQQIENWSHQHLFYDIMQWRCSDWKALAGKAGLWTWWIQLEIWSRRARLALTPGRAALIRADTLAKGRGDPDQKFALARSRAECGTRRATASNSITKIQPLYSWCKFGSKSRAIITCVLLYCPIKCFQCCNWNCNYLPCGQKIQLLASIFFISVRTKAFYICDY